MEDSKRLKEKFFFIRVNEATYRRIEALAKEEERSINGMANYLLKQSLKDLPKPSESN